MKSDEQRAVRARPAMRNVKSRAGGGRDYDAPGEDVEASRKSA